MIRLLILWLQLATVLPAAPLPAVDPAAAGLSSERLERVHRLLQSEVDAAKCAGAITWTGYATTYCNIDPVEGTVALVFAQHVPYDEFGLFPRFSTTFYQAIVASRGK